MKRSAPIPTQLAVQSEAPSLSLGVIRTALIGLAAVVLLLLGLFYFFRARTHHTVITASPTAVHASELRMTSVSAAVPKRSTR